MQKNRQYHTYPRVYAPCHFIPGSDRVWQPSALLFSSNGALLAIGCEDGTHYVYGQNPLNDQYEQLTQQKHHSDFVRTIIVSAGFARWPFLC